MTITTKQSATGRISAYYVDGVKVRKNEINDLVLDAYHKGEIIEVDYYVGQEFSAIIRGYDDTKIVFTGYGKMLMTQAAAEELGCSVIRKWTGTYFNVYLVEKKAEPLEADTAEYVITAEALEVATDAEIELANGSQRQEIVNPTADDFMTKLAALKADVDNSEAEDKKARDAEMQAYQLWQAAKAKAQQTAEKRSAAISEYNRLGCTKARSIMEKLLPAPIVSKTILVTQDKQRFEGKPITRIAFYQEQFIIAHGIIDFGRYDTPAQVQTVFNQLKSAIERGDSEFKFPTVEELNNPPPDVPDNSTPDKLRDSLARGMEIALLNIQIHCRDNNLNAACYELELYNICSRGLLDLRNSA